MAIDAGTGSCRAVLFDGEGHQRGVGQHEWSHPEEPGIPGSRLFETDRNWRLICACMREALRQAGVPAATVCAVTASSMREGMVLYDGQGRELWACPNVDGRAGMEAVELVQSGAADEIYGRSGDWVAITAPPRFRWLAKHRPETFRAIRHAGMLSDWILYRLSGCFVTDPSAGSSSAMFDLERRTWSEPVLELLGLDRQIFPSVLEPGTVLGELTPDASAETGLVQGTPVVVGGADTQLGLVGIGAVEPGRFTVIGGSFWQHTVALDTPVVDPEGRLRTLCHSVPKQWMLEGIGFLCGLTLRWFRDAFCQYEKGVAEREGIDVYALLEREASAVPPGSNGVIGIFSNLMNAKRWLHASPGFLQFDLTSPEHSGKKECLRAIEEAAAYVSNGHLRVMEQVSGRRLEEVVLAGGAAKGTLWPQILADVLGVHVRVPAVKESTALGAAIYAGLGVGLYDDLADAVRRVVRFEREVEPDPQTHERYRSLYEQWLQVYARALQLSEDGLLRPLWCAAGVEARREREDDARSRSH